MPHIPTLLATLGGLAQKQQLVALGASDLDLTRAVRAASVIRARQGWYTIWPADDDRVRAVRVGGRLTGLSAVAAAGGWVRQGHPLHVSVPRNAARLRSASNRFEHPGAPRIEGVRLHWESPIELARGTLASVSTADALVRVALDEALDDAVAAFDWALHSGAIDRIEFERIILELPKRVRSIADWVDPACESLPESLARTRLRMRGHAVTTQVRLGEFQRVDLVVDGCVGLETDGDLWHRDRFEEDRRKDLDMTIARLHALRASARAVFHDWERVERAVEVAVAARRPSLSFGNSGVRILSRRRKPGNSGRRPRRRTPTPEFPNSPRNTATAEALTPP